MACLASPYAAGQLGIHGITLLVIRPDGYIGLRSDRNYLAAMENYVDLIRSSVMPRVFAS
jgi:hypothetical protein